MRPGVLLLGACAWCSCLPASIPMAQTREASPTNAKCLVMLLPGAGDHDSTFREQGFVGDLLASGASVEVIALDATLGYYMRGIAAERIEADVAVPARERVGDKPVWLIGASMGGFGTMHYASQYGHVDGLLAIAPFLGDVSLADEIKAAGGLKAWPGDPKAQATKDNYQRQMWSWLHRVVTGEEKGPALYLGSGDEDTRGLGGQLFADALPADHVFRSPGGHDWAPWRGVLKQFLATPAFRDQCMP